MKQISIVSAESDSLTVRRFVAYIKNALSEVETKLYALEDLDSISAGSVVLFESVSNGTDVYDDALTVSELKSSPVFYLSNNSFGSAHNFESYMGDHAGVEGVVSCEGTPFFEVVTNKGWASRASDILREYCSK